MIVHTYIGYIWTALREQESDTLSAQTMKESERTKESESESDDLNLFRLSLTSDVPLEWQRPYLYWCRNFNNNK